MSHKKITIGLLAKKTGVTTRTLRHYDELGLVPHFARSASGYRLYNEDGVNRLEVVILLRRLGFSLAEIKTIFNNPKLSFVDIVKNHVPKLKNRAKREYELYERLERIARFLEKKKVSSLEEFVKLLNHMSKRSLHG